MCLVGTWEDIGVGNKRGKISIVWLDGEER